MRRDTLETAFVRRRAERMSFDLMPGEVLRFK
jgi:hypothetical protein